MKKLLSVDDSSMIHKFIGYSLKGKDFLVTSAGDGVEALECLEKELFDIIILDLNMPLNLDLPDSKGLESLARLRDQVPGVPVIILGRSEDENMALKAVQEGAMGFMVKGQTDAYMLSRVIQSAMGRHDMKRKLQDLEKEKQEIIDMFVADSDFRAYCFHALEKIGQAKDTTKAVDIYLEGIQPPVGRIKGSVLLFRNENHLISVIGLKAKYFLSTQLYAQLDMNRKRLLESISAKSSCLRKWKP